MTFNFGLVAHYINTKNNLVADTLSRLLYINSEQEVIGVLQIQTSAQGRVKDL